MTLSDYLERAAATPFAYGAFDCLIFLADWVVDQHGVDPAEPWRGKYGCEREALRILKRHNGMAGLVRDAVGRSLIEVRLPKPGDIGIVRPTGHREHMGAIRTSVGWAVLKRSGGVWVGPHDCAMAWSIG